MRRDLRLGRLLAVWAPLAATFLLVTGSTPVINASINRLPGRLHEVDLAAFALFLNFIVVLHSPLFVTREIAIKLSVDRAGARRALLFCLAAAGVISLVELLIGATPLGAWLMGAFADRADVVDGAHRAFLYIWPAPFMIAVRGVYQAHQIQRDDTLFVSLGTAVRVMLTALFGLWLAPHLGISGPVLGAAGITLGIAVETIFSVVRAQRVARPPEFSTATPFGLAGFALPLMFANLLGVLTSLFYLRVAALVPSDLQESSLAAYQEVRPLAWLFTAGGFAIQSLTTAKVRGPEDERPMVRFSAVVGSALSLLFALCVFVPPVRRWILIDLMGEQAGGTVYAFAVPTLMLAVLLPIFQSLRFGLRGILISRGQTRVITLTNILSLALLASAVSFRLLASDRNGALNAYVLWTGVMIVELTILLRLILVSKKDGGTLPPPARAPEEAAGG
jgi:Na+-driven multidrug efflux pump